MTQTQIATFFLYFDFTCNSHCVQADQWFKKYSFAVSFAMKFLNIKNIVNILFLLFCALCVNSLAFDDERGSFLFYMPMAFKYVEKASYSILVSFQINFMKV